MGAVLALLAVVFVSFLSHLNRMLYGTPPAGEVTERPTERWSVAHCAALDQRGVLVVLGLTSARAARGAAQSES